jgi:ABC-type sugar transport system ATPase subunit
MEPMPEIRTESISKTFPDGTQALRSVSLQVKNGELLALVGPSGCGKTTLLRIISGLESPSEGQLFFDKEKVTHLSPERRDLGMVFQNYALFPHLSIFRNIGLGLGNSPLSKAEKKQTVEQVSKNLGLYEYLERKPAELSGGQRQRVALARLLVRNPSIHLLDEPLSNLDANLRMKMREELANLHIKHAKTTIFVTHDQIEAMTLGQRICLLNHGKIEQIGTPEELYLNPCNLFVANFFGIPPINILQGNSHYSDAEGSGIFRCQKSSLSLKTLISHKKDRKNLTLGIRPENIKIMADDANGEFLIKRIEYLGDSQIVHLSFENINLTCKQPISGLRSGERVALAIDWESSLWFDSNTKNRVQLIES